MRLSPVGVVVRGEVAGEEVRVEAPLAGAGTVALGPLTVHVDATPRLDRITWEVANRGDVPVSVRVVALVLLAEARGPIRLFRNGYQSWSESGGARLGIDQDPSRGPGASGGARMMHHADRAVADEHELRSEQVTVLASRTGHPVLLGFEGGHDHDGTIRVRPDERGAALHAEAFLGGARLDPGAQRKLHPVIIDEGDEPAGLLARWAGRVGAVTGARTGAPYQVGWCSWYHYFHDVTESHVRANLALAADWPFDVFQIDDGYQAAIGDWLDTKRSFPSGIDALASDIAAAGRQPGIWLAPFLAHPSSAVARTHPGWLARWVDGQRPLMGMVNEAWGGAVATLDTTNPDVLDHLEATARSLVAAGYRYLKLDFTYAPAFEGVFADPTRTPAERVRAGFDAIRRGAGDDAFILGCGAPLGAAVGVVDGMRIGPDVAPWWAPPEDRPAAYRSTYPATRSAWRNTLARSFMHRRLWLNDPDCLMLRTRATHMSPASVRAWALAVGASGGMALVSDDLSLLDADARSLLDEVTEVGRAADALARDGSPPTCPDLLDSATPRRLVAGRLALVGDPDAGTARLEPARP
jgi:alpha-galactosidase